MGKKSRYWWLGFGVLSFTSAVNAALSKPQPGDASVAGTATAGFLISFLFLILAYRANKKATSVKTKVHINPSVLNVQQTTYVTPDVSSSGKNIISDQPREPISLVEQEAARRRAEKLHSDIGITASETKSCPTCQEKLLTTDIKYCSKCGGLLN